MAQGEAIVRHPPDVAWVQVAVEARGAKPEEARQRAADSMTSVLAALKPVVPAPNLRTSGLSVTPEMDYTTSGSRLKGYLARNQVEARVDNLELLSKVMDAAIATGATSITGLRFDVKARAQHERDALRSAVQDATERAQAIAAGAGRSLGPIVRIQEQRMSSTPYRVTMGGRRRRPRRTAGRHADHSRRNRDPSRRRADRVDQVERGSKAQRPKALTGPVATPFVKGPLMRRSILMLLVLASPSAAVAQGAPAPPSIVTRGQATLKRVPDQAWVQIAAETRAQMPAEAQRLAAEAMTSVQATLKKAGIAADAMKTSGYSLQPDIDWSGGRSRVRGYIARNQIEVRVDALDRIGAVIDAAGSSGATSMAGLRFDLKDRVARRARSACAWRCRTRWRVPGRSPRVRARRWGQSCASTSRAASLRAASTT